jgi:hypothetical protein
MLTVSKLVKIKEYEDLQETIKKERLNKTIDIFKDVETEDEWKQKKEEIKRSKEIELENRELHYKNKDIERKEEWKRKKEEIKQSKEIELKKREVYFKNKENKQYVSEADDKKNKEIQQKVLEHRQRLQKMYDERISRKLKN